MRSEKRKEVMLIIIIKLWVGILIHKRYRNLFNIYLMNLKYSKYYSLYRGNYYKML